MASFEMPDIMATLEASCRQLQQLLHTQQQLQTDKTHASAILSRLRIIGNLIASPYIVVVAAVVSRGMVWEHAS